MWDDRYKDEEYAYGKTPNTFLSASYRAIPKGNVLCLAEGEGRNAVFLAQRGYSVTAVDSSSVGLQKAEMLAMEHEVAIELVHADLAEYDIGENRWDGIVSIFCPLPSALRRKVYQRCVSGLKVGGIFLLEAYRPEQLQHGTGGGDAVDTMTTRQSLLSDLEGLEFRYLEDVERRIIEGKYHTGVGAVVQTIAKKAV